MASSSVFPSEPQPEGFIKIDKNIGGKMITLIKTPPDNVDKIILKLVSKKMILLQQYY